jgi:hypothetical protein
VGTWKVRTLHRVISLRLLVTELATVDGSKELAKYNFNFVGKEEVRWEKGYSEQTLKYVSEKKVMLIPTLF